MAHIKKVDKGPIASKTLLRKSGRRPRKRLGQNFLEDHALVQQIIAQAGFKKKDVVIEIGPGLGALTIPALPHIYHLVAIEKDPLLITILKERLSLQEKAKITFISEDALKFDFKGIYDTFHQKMRIIGNLPYNISSPFLEKLIINRMYIKNATLMFQYEFAKRLAAKPRDKEYGALSVICQHYAAISPLIRVKRDAFYPKPKVDSMVVEIDFEKPYPLQAENEMMFRKTVKAAFSCRRKTILNSLEKGMMPVSREMLKKALKECLIDSTRRAETIPLDDYLHLSSILIRDKTIS